MRHSESARHRIRRRSALLILALAALLLAAAAALAQGGYDLSWHAISAGGGHSAGGGFVLDGGPLHLAGAMQGGNYQVASGFWPGMRAAEVQFTRVWLPALIKRMTP